jgi:transglutaminase-like putative cysteine protease
MKLSIHARLDYDFPEPADVILQVEAADIPEQAVVDSDLHLTGCDRCVRVAAHNRIGERICFPVVGPLVVDYRATVEINRILTDCRVLPKVPIHQLPGEAIEYLMPSRYCQSDQFESFVEAEFKALEGGARVVAMRDWVRANFAYVPGSSDATTTALETFVKRQGVCRDFAHMMIALVRASGIPARIASVYALGVDPPDFHAVAEIFLGGEWHLFDATGMANAQTMAKIGIGRDAADVAFLTAYDEAVMNAQSVSVLAV